MIPSFEYAAFVWSSYLVFAVVVGWQVLQPMLRRRRIRKQWSEQFDEMRAAHMLDEQTRMENSA